MYVCMYVCMYVQAQSKCITCNYSTLEGPFNLDIDFNNY